MSNVEKTSEPSMDEILNSIRKIIADDPTGSRPAQPTSVVPLPPPGIAALSTSRMTATPPPPPAPSRNPVPPPSAVDDVLDDFARGPPTLRPSPPATPAVSARTNSDAPSWSPPHTSGSGEKLPPAPQPPPPLTLKPFFGLPPGDSLSLETTGVRSAPNDRPANTDFGSFIPKRPDGPLTPQSLPEFVLPPERPPVRGANTEVKPSPNGQAQARPAYATPAAQSAPAVDEKSPPLAQPVEKGVPAPTTPQPSDGGRHTQVATSTAAPAVNAATVAAGVKAAEAPSATPTGRTSLPSSNGPAGEERRVPPAASQGNGADKPDMVISGPPLSQNRLFPPAPSHPATQSSPPAVTPPQNTPLAARQPVNTPAQYPPGQAGAAPKPASAPAAAPARTMEDTVAELLRPMLRQWLDANMPRIVEKALRVELADESKKKH